MGWQRVRRLVGAICSGLVRDNDWSFASHLFRWNNAVPLSVRRHRRRWLLHEGLETRHMFASFYVTTVGDNTNDGQSPGTSWATLQYAADRVNPGDTVYVAAGEYVGFDLSRSGQANARIVFHGEPGATIVQRNRRTADGINLEGADHVTIEGFTVIGVPRAGIRSVVNEGAIIRQNRTANNGVWGIFTGFSEGVLIESNETSGSVREHGIYVSNSADRPVIRNNRVWGNNASGIQINADLSEGGDGIVDHALIEGNIIFGNGAGGGSAINLDGVQESIIQNNLMYDNRASGISLYQIDGAQGSRNNLIVNNTIISAVTGRWALNIQDDSTGNRIFNNIIYSEHGFRGAIDIAPTSLPGFASDYNVVESRFTTNGGDSVLTLAQWQTATGQDRHSIVGDLGTLFVNRSAADYRLRVGSVAIDAGTATVAPLTDLAGRSRPVGTGVDVGAYEFRPNLRGDFDDNGLVNSLDIDLLYAAVRTSDNNVRWDLTGDGLVSRLDVDVLVREILLTDYGDANLDRAIDGADLAAWQSHQYTATATWGAGDFNGDGVVDGGDFHDWLRHRRAAPVERAAEVARRQGRPLFRGRPMFAARLLPVRPEDVTLAPSGVLRRSAAPVPE